MAATATATGPALTNTFTFSFDNPLFPNTAASRSANDEPSTLQQHHRRIDLQSPQDLLYLRDNVRRAALGRIDVHLPEDKGQQGKARQETTVVDGGAAAGEEGAVGAAGGEDTLRRGVVENVDTWITKLFEAARGNVSINGIEGEDVQFGTLLGGASSSSNADGGDVDGTDAAAGAAEEYEAYDTRLAARITALYATIEKLNLELADTRRVAVKEAARGFEERWISDGGAMDEALARAAGAGEGEIEMGGDSALVESVRERLWHGKGRQAEVRETWEGAVRGLKDVRMGLEETKGRAERARRVVGALEG